MNLFLRNVKVIDPGSEFNQQSVDIYIKNGQFERIDRTISAPSKTKTWEFPNCYVSPGWLDIGTQIAEPGFEQRDTLQTTNNSAIYGGYTGIACFPNTNPVIDNKSQIQFIVNRTRDMLVDFFPIAALSRACEGNELSEIIDLKTEGAIAFSDGLHSIQSNRLMVNALEYCKSVDALIIHQALEKEIAKHGLMHEGEVSTGMGVMGIPEMAESIFIQRDIKLNDYAQSKLLLHNLSSGESVKWIKKSGNDKLYSSVSYLNLIFNDKALENFDTNYKVLPPLRSENDRKALLKAVKSGSIDCITSNHISIESEIKELEFENSEFGAIGLETCFSGLCSYLEKELNLQKMIDLLSIAPRRILSLEVPHIMPGQPSNITVFDPEKRWQFSSDKIQSKSKNSPFIDKPLKGKVLGVINNNKAFLCE